MYWILRTYSYWEEAFEPFKLVAAVSEKKQFKQKLHRNDISRKYFFLIYMKTFIKRKMMIKCMRQHVKSTPLSLMSDVCTSAGSDGNSNNNNNNNHEQRNPYAASAMLGSKCLPYMCMGDKQNNFTISA